MFKIKIIFSIFIFSFLLIGTSIVKNQTREIEKKISSISKMIMLKEKDLNESQLDFSYLTSPAMIEKKIEHLGQNQYSPMEISRIFLNMNSFINLQNKFATQRNINEKKEQKR